MTTCSFAVTNRQRSPSLPAGRSTGHANGTLPHGHPAVISRWNPYDQEAVALRFATTNEFRQTRKSRVGGFLGCFFALIAASFIFAQSPQASFAVVYTYTPLDGAYDLWPDGTHWNAVPISSTDTVLTFVGDNATTLANGLNNTNVNILAPFSLNTLNLQGTGPANGAATININSASTSGGYLNFAGYQFSVVNLHAMAGAAGLTYNVGSNLNLETSIRFQGNGTAAFNFNGIISGGGGILKGGNSVLTLAGANTYTGKTFVGEGTLVLANSHALQNSTLYYGGGAVAFGNLTSVTIGGLKSPDYVPVPLTLTNDSGQPVTLSVGANHQSTTYGGTIAGAGSLNKIGSGTLTFSNANYAGSFTGDLIASEGTLSLPLYSQPPLQVTLNLNGGNVDFGGASWGAVGGLKGSGDLTLNGIGLGIGYNNQSTTYSGVLSGSMSIGKFGTGSLTLSGANQHTGDTYMGDGTLVLANSHALQNSTLYYGGGAVAFGNLTSVTIGGLKSPDYVPVPLTLTNDSGQPVTLSVGANHQSTTYSGKIVGAGSLNKIGSGTLNLSNVNYAGSFTGDLIASEGTLSLPTSLYMSPQVTLNLNGGNVDFGGAFWGAVGGLKGSGNLTLNDTSLDVGYNNQSTTYSGVLSGSMSIGKFGTGSLTLAGANQHTGATFMGDGTLVLANSHALQNSTLDYYGGAVAFGNLTSVTIGGLKNLSFVSPTLTLINDYGQPVTLSVGANNKSTTYSGKIVGAGSLNKIGSGTLTLTNRYNTYAGPTMIQAGTLALSGTGSLASSVINVASGATYDVSAKNGYHLLAGQTLKGNGTVVGKTFVDAGAHVAPGNSIGTLNWTGDLTLNGYADFELGTPGANHASPGLGDLVNVGGNLTLDGVLNLIDNAGANGQGWAGAGSYKLLTWTGLQSGNFSSIVNPTAGLHATTTIDSTDKAFYVDLYRVASFDLSPQSVNLGRIMRGGAFATQTLSVSNTAADDGYSEKLDAGFGDTTGDATADGSFNLLAAGATNDTDLVVGLGNSDTNLVGRKNGTATVLLASNGQGTSEYGATALSSQTVNITGAVLANRQLTVDAVGSAAQAARVVRNSPYVTSLHTGSDPAVDGDDAATRVNTVAGIEVVCSRHRLSVTYQGTPLVQFNGVDQSADIALNFAQTGLYQGEIDLAPAMLGNGEAASVGATVQPAALSYNVNVLDPRNLRAVKSRVNFGNVLRGATVSGNFTVKSLNGHPDAEHTTVVDVASGGAALGNLTVAETFVGAGGSIGVPVSGTLDAYGKVTVRGAVPVTTAEAAEVQDATNYADLKLSYTANVGLARFGRDPTSFNNGETVLSANVEAGSQLTHLSSMVKPRGMLASNATLAAQVTGPASLKGLYGGVGSEAEIVASTTLTNDGTVTMQWRRRTYGESNYPEAAHTTLPADSWLVSDVVKIGGIGDDVCYALQMSFDNRINLAFDGPTDGQVANEFPNLFLAELDASDNQWKNAATLVAAGSAAEPGVLTSLNDFLDAHNGTSLFDLLGSWGVDPATSVKGLGYAWAIIAGDGVFAVDPGPGSPTTAPEPGALVLLLIAALSLLGYARRCRR